MFASVIHDLSPYLVHFGGNAGIRWYGLSYIAAFVAGFYLLQWLSRKSLWIVPREKALDFVTYAALFGVFIGGRLGYMLFYDMKSFLADPAIIVTGLLRCQGGMASHGGILGLILFTLFYAWRHRLNWPGVGDGLVVAAPLGICFVRIANYVNGELWGRPTQASWARIFPGELYEIGGAKYRGVCDFLRIPYEISRDQFTDAVRARIPGDQTLVDMLHTLLPGRHPSQIYQALCEGLALFLLLFAVRLLFKRLPHGILTGLFFLGYAGARIWMENFREPDRGIEGVFGLSRGQSLSLAMIPIGIAFIGYGIWRWRTDRPSEPVGTSSP